MVGEKVKEADQGLRRARLLRYLPPLLVVLAVGVAFSSGLHHALSFETLVAHQNAIRAVVAAHPVWAACLYVLVYASIVTLSIPASIFLSMTGGYLFGWAIGGALAAVSATLGAGSIFLIARTSIAEPLLRRAGSRIQRLAAGFRADAFSYLLFLRLLPVMPFWVTNLAAALFGMRLRTFLIGTQLGVIPICYAFAVAGSGLDTVIAAQERMLAACRLAGRSPCVLDFHPESLLSWQLVLALAVLGILALGPILAKRWQARRRETDG
ncbi:TVP38/TMEM64 family protein [Microvirga antarctica]|uniref:TVP38/TMEM64 family protein n=1 Tax=Microvirga antarctica TaxID=2819233 RepID=UPI001B308E79|nr:TVP38/TMEM64 family protein [Microvirga antarctica]